MTNEWREVTIGDIAARTRNALVGGPFGSNLVSRDYVDAGVPVIRGQNMGERWVAGDFAFVTEQKAHSLEANLARPGDVIFTQRGTIGQVSLVSTMPYQRYLVSQSQMKLTVDPELADPLYVYYAFLTQEHQDYIRRNAIQTGVPHTNLGILRATRILLPPLPEQRAIAHILGSLDDKIELNRRMNATLEGMARALFQAWFVDFAPVRAKLGWQETGLPQEIADLFPAALVASEVGEIPEGWQIGVLGDVAEDQRRGVQPDEVDPAMPYIGLEHMPRRSMALNDWGVAEGLESNKLIFKRGQILFGKLRSYFHKVGVAPLDGICSTDIVVIAPKTHAWFGFVLGHASSDPFVQFTTAGSTGTKMPRTSWNEMARYKLVLPQEAVACAFTELISPLVERMIASIHEARTLAALRDALLPRLISGEVRVSKAEGRISTKVQ